MPREAFRPMDQMHPYAVRQDVMHGCPECFPQALPLCPVCLGVGMVTGDRLARYQLEQRRDADQ